MMQVEHYTSGQTVAKENPAVACFCLNVILAVISPYFRPYFRLPSLLVLTFLTSDSLSLNPVQLFHPKVPIFDIKCVKLFISKPVNAAIK